MTRNRRSNGSSKQRHNRLHTICDQDGWRCYYCKVRLYCAVCYPDLTPEAGLQPATRDHFIPLGRGGKPGVVNMVPACPSCNQNKGDLLPSELLIGRGNKVVRVARARPVNVCRRKVFATEELARLMCAAVLEQHGKELVPYWCSSTNEHWHLRLSHLS